MSSSSPLQFWLLPLPAPSRGSAGGWTEGSPGVPSRGGPLPPNLGKKKKVKFTYGEQAEGD